MDGIQILSTNQLVLFSIGYELGSYLLITLLLIELLWCIFCISNAKQPFFLFFIFKNLCYVIFLSSVE